MASKEVIRLFLERAPFVFTEEMAFLMGGREGEDFLLFQKYCTDAYNLVRKNGFLIIQLFMMMLSGGMPEL